MSYLVPNDINRLIQEPSLMQIISGNSLLTYQSETVAITEIKSYLRQKYSVDTEFTDSTVYNPATIYHATDRVYLDAPAYSAAATYLLNALTLQAGSVYYCSTAIIAPEVFNPAHWNLLGIQYTIFFAQYPFPLFQLATGCYAVGDQVWWAGHIYTAKVPSQSIGQEEAIQYQNVAFLPYRNVFPDNVINGSAYWTDNGAYNIPAGSLLVQNPAPTFQFFQARADLFITGGVTTGFPAGQTTYTAPGNSLKGWTYSYELIDQGTLTPDVDYTLDANDNPILNRDVQPNEKFCLHFNPVVTEEQTQPLPGSQTISQLIATYFTVGDNRNQQLVLMCLDIMIFHLYSRIPPQVVPENRIYRYEKAKQWLNNVAKGDEIVPDIPKLQPPQGSRIRFSSQVKQANNY